MYAFRKTLIAGCIAAAFVPAAQAEKFYGGSSISLLYSEDYEIFGTEKETATVFTFENVTGHNWGDTFIFFDRYQVQESSDSADNTYGEFAPRLSLGWLSGQDLSFGPVKDVLLAAQYEYGGGTELNNYMGGLGLSWNLPGFSYFNTNAYYVDNSAVDNDFQLTVTWGLPFEAGPALFLFDGYMDWSTAESDHDSEFQITPQLKLDLGNFSGNPGVLYAGVEYSYWNNKYGLPDAVMDTQSALSALVKFHF